MHHPLSSAPAMSEHGAMPPSREAIAAYLYRHGEATIRELAAALGFSLPTVSHHLRGLEEEHIVFPGSMQDSTGGRRPKTYRFASSRRVAIGIAPQRDGVTMCAVDLHGHAIAERFLPMTRANTSAHCQRLGQAIDDFADTITDTNVTVATVAILADNAEAERWHSKTSPCASGADADMTLLGNVARFIHHPCTMVRECDATAMVEIWDDSTLRDALCLHLDRNPSASLIIDGTPHPRQDAHSGTIMTHMTLIPGGRMCRCGRRGCMAAYCSLDTLVEDGESIPGFFSVLEQGEPHHRTRLGTWLDHVAQALANVEAIVGGDIILGGEAMLYLDDDDIATLSQRIRDLAPSGVGFSLRASRCPASGNAVGAALVALTPYVAALRSLQPTTRR